MRGRADTWYCTRQRAGPLVKECRALRPRYGAQDTAEDRREKKKIKQRQSAVTRTQIDKLELRLALIGWSATHYVLTFDAEHLPRDFSGVRRALQNFFKRSQRWRAGLGKPAAFDYAYAIEGLHGDHRYHIHFVCDYYDISPAEMRELWTGGGVDDSPVLMRTGGFRRLAEYLNKERTDGVVIPIGRHPWSCSRTLTAKLPAVERWTDTSGDIIVPESAIWVRRSSVSNDFGAYYYANWIEPDESPECRRYLWRIKD